MMRALILTPLLILATLPADAAVRGPSHASGSAVLTLTATTGAPGVSGDFSMPVAPAPKANATHAPRS
jgi:hypothetical protein